MRSSQQYMKRSESKSSSSDSKVRSVSSSKSKSFNKKESQYTYVENLSPNVNTEHLTEIFSTFGKVKSVYKMKTNPWQRRKISALILFEGDQESEVAQRCMHNGQIDGMKLRVENFKLEVKDVEAFMAGTRIEDIIHKTKYTTETKIDNKTQSKHESKNIDIKNKNVNFTKSTREKKHTKHSTNKNNKPSRRDDKKDDEKYTNKKRRRGNSKYKKSNKSSSSSSSRSDSSSSSFSSSRSDSSPSDSSSGKSSSSSSSS